MPSVISVALGASEGMTSVKAATLGENPVRGVRDGSRWGIRGADGVGWKVGTGGVGEYS